MRKYIYATISVCILLSVGVTSYAQTVVRGPYLQIGTPNSMTIKWRTNSATSTKVWYGNSPGNLPFTQTINGTRTDHEVTISGLAPNSTYFYTVGNSSTQLVQPSSNHYFRTSPNPGSTQTIRTWVLGDCGTGDTNQRAVRDAFYNFNGSQHIDMILMLGDNAYEDGTDSEFQAALFENMYEDQIIHTVMWPAIGNHETVTADSPSESGPYYDIFTLPRNGEAGGVPSGTEAYYSFDYGNIHCIVLDSDDTPKDPGDPMLVWLENDLQNTNQDWIVAYWHHPPYSKGGDSDTNAKEIDMRENIGPILENYGVDLVLAGHSHNWQRSYLIHGHYGLSNSWNPNTMGIDLGNGRLDGDGAYMKNANGEGTVYIVTGSAGKRGGTITDPHPIMYESISDYGSMYMEVTGGQMDIKFIRSNGVIHDYLTIMKQVATGVPPSVSITAPAHGTNYTSPQPVTLTADASDSDGTVTQVEFFVNGNSVGVDNQAPYAVSYTPSGEGTFEVTARATDNDDNTTQSAAIQFTVGPVTICVRIETGDDDGEERSSGNVNLTSSDLELVEDGGLGNQTVGLRFNGLNIPQGANIASAYIQFTADENSNVNPCTMTIYGVDSDNVPNIPSGNFGISNQPRTANSVSWTPSDWLAIGDSGPAQQTPSLTSIIQEIVDRPNFSSSSSIALIIEGVGRRTAESYEGSAINAPELCIEYSMGAISFDCPNIPANIGTPCDDGDNTTLNDMIDANCNCTGTPTACTGVGDMDGDGVCADVDCDDLDASITHRTGDACDDGNLATMNDAYDANCNCVGVFNTCPGIGDNDGDGICADIDCDDNDPNATSVAGDPCDDGDPTTINDVYGSNCNCAGTPTACTGIGDADGDGICADVDCDDNDPNNTNYPGVACDDGNPNTVGETIQNDCSCGGGISGADYTCVQVNTSSDDAEQRTFGVDLSSGDLELVNDPNLGDQVVGMRFTGLNIPQGATILSAYLQFTADENRNTDPCNLTIFGEDTDNASTFSTLSNTDISSRPRTGASVDWSPPMWSFVGESDVAQRTPDISTIIQEIVNRNQYTSSSALVLMIEGTGSRTAEAFEGGATVAPQLCVSFTTVQYDCPNLQANIGDACDDGDNTTINDMIGANCNCAGTPTACTGIGDADGDGVCSDLDCDDNNAAITSVDADGDGVCSDVDCDDNDAAITYQPGDTCDDGDNTTFNDMIDANCNCSGTPTACTGVGDADGDGVCSDLDCDDNNASITTIDADNDGVCSDVDCDDNDPNVTSTNIGDADCDGVPTGIDCDDNDPNVTSTNINDADCDGVPTGIDCDDNDASITSTNVNDADCDGVPSSVDCDDNDPTITTTNAGDGDCDGVPTAQDCDDTDASIGSNANDMDCDGVPSNLDCDDNDPNITSTNVGDADCDGVPSNLDCDDNDPNITSTNVGDADCDGVPTAQDCDDNDPSVGSNANDMDCDGVPTAEDCNDNDPNVGSSADDMDCDGVPASIDCDDNNASITSTNVNDADCDGVPTGVDCDDNDPTIGGNANDMDCDGVPAGIDCDDNDPNVISSNVNDADCDGVPTSVDCDDNDPNIAYQPGDACNDGNPATFGETIQSDCSCGGGTSTPTTTCSTINSSSDDIEERTSTGRMDLTSSDLELGTDAVSQWVGLRFNNLNIPQGAQITSAYIQFETDETRNFDPFSVTIYGQAADNAATFTSTDYDASSRPRTSNSVSWAPPIWPTVGQAGPNQQTPDLSAIIQEIVSRNGYTENSSLAFILEGTGRRVAESFDGPSGGPTLCVDYFHTPPPYDCPSLSAYIGDACDDGDNTTINDMVDGDCNCVGTPTACTGIGDTDGDGVCDDVDCDINNPNISTQPGDACDDGDPATINDVVDANCNCAGTLNSCPGVGDMDGDGICADVDCNDNDPNITAQVGDACDDGNPATHGETIQADCSCGGGSVDPESVCSTINFSTDDAEQETASGRMDLNSSDLELCTDGISQWVGLRFNNLNIPQGASIVSAYIQFEADETGNDDPCNLTIYGVAADNAATFSATDFDISSRPRTANSVAWAPPHWLSISDAGPAQKTPGLEAILQEIVNRAGYTSASSIAFVIEGTGRRVAESFDGPAGGPTLCIEYFATPPDYDCPSLSAFIGDACDDGDNTTINDTIDSDCNCSGTPTACTGIGDADGDGVCSNVDCDDNNPNIATQPGDACDDGDPATVNDVIDANCGCAGTLNSCPGVGDQDGDGICSDVDCNDNDPNITTQQGDACDDGNPNTVGETIQADCTCGGGNSTPTQTCSMISASSDDAEEQGGPADLSSSDLELMTDPNLGIQQVGLRFNGLSIPQGAIITSAYIQFTADESVNDDPCNISIYGEAADNAPTFASITNNIGGRPRTTAVVNWTPGMWQAVGDSGPEQKTPDLSAIVQEIVNRGGYTANSSIVFLLNGTGRRTAESFEGSVNGAAELCVEYLYAPPAANSSSGSTTAITDREGTGVEQRTVVPSVETNKDAVFSPISVHPNPASSKLNVTFSSTVDGPVTLQARDLNGRVVLQDVRELKRGNNIIVLEELSLPSGIYFLQLSTNDATQSAKFVIAQD